MLGQPKFSGRGGFRKGLTREKWKQTVGIVHPDLPPDADEGNGPPERARIETQTLEPISRLVTLNGDAKSVDANPVPEREPGFSFQPETWFSQDKTEGAEVDLAKILPPFDVRKFNPALKLETRGVTPQISQKEFWDARSVQRHTIAAKLREVGQDALAIKLDECGSQLTYALCKGCSKVEIFVNRCDLKCCPSCQPRLARLRRDSVEWWTQGIKQPKHIVLTLTNTADILPGHVQELKLWFTRLRRRKFAANWKGGFYSIEVTNESRGWHLHLHALVNAGWIDAKQLAVEWGKVTRGAGYIVKVKDVREGTYLKEVCKYAVKGTQLAKWSAAQVEEFILAFENQRTFGVFGQLYGKRTEWREWLKAIRTKAATCACGCVDRWFFSEFEWQARDLVPNAQPRHPKANVPTATFQGQRWLGIAH